MKLLRALNQKQSKLLLVLEILVLGIVLLLFFSGNSKATDVPGAANVNEGQAVVRIDDPVTGDIQFQLATPDFPTGDDWNIAQGQTRTLTFTFVDTAITFNVPDGNHANDQCDLLLLWDNGATILRTLASADTCPADGTSYTISPTSNGDSGGIARAGTVRIKLFIRDANVAGATNYELNSDDKNAAEQAGALRFGMDVTAISHGGFPAGTIHAFTVAGESMSFSVTHTPADTNQGTRFVTWRTVQQGASCSTFTTIESTNRVMDLTGPSTQSFTVSDTYPASSSNIGLVIDSIFDATLTTTDWTFFTGSPFSCGNINTDILALHGRIIKADFVALDPRISTTHLIQFDDSVFGTPPMSKDDCCTRLTTQIGFLASRFTNARNEGLAGASFTFNTNIKDQNDLGTPINCNVGTIATQGGEAGWSAAFCQWSSTLPGGIWIKTVDVTAPTTIDAASHLQFNTKNYILASVNPDLVGTLIYRINEKNGLNITFFVTSITDASLIPLDTNPSPGMILTRQVGTTGTKVEFLDSDFQWKSLTTVAFKWNFNDLPGPMWNKSFTPARLRTWGDTDFQVTASGFSSGAPVGALAQISNIVGNLETSSLEVTNPALDRWIPTSAFALILFISMRFFYVWPAAGATIGIFVVWFGPGLLGGWTLNAAGMLILIGFWIEFYSRLAAYWNQKKSQRQAVQEGKRVREFNDL